MSTCGICVQPFDFVSNSSPRGHDLCVLYEDIESHIENLDVAEHTTQEAIESYDRLIESYDRLEEEMAGLRHEFSNARDTIKELEKTIKVLLQDRVVAEETELC